MSSRPFAQIDCTLAQSKKMRSLKSSEARYAYVCVHLSDHGSYTGMFRYSKIVWADDACLSPDALAGAIDDLVSNDLIEFDHDEQLVRVIGWFHKRNAPENASRMQSLIADFLSRDTDNEAMFLRSVAEFTAGSVKRAQRWKPDSPEWPKLREAFKPFLRQIYQEFGDDFIEALTNEVDASSKATKAEIHSMFPPLTLAQRSPSGHPAVTVGAHETKTIRDVNENENKDGYENDTAVSDVNAGQRSCLEELAHPFSPEGSTGPKGRAKSATINSPLAREAKASGQKYL